MNSHKTKVVSSERRRAAIDEALSRWFSRFSDRQLVEMFSRGGDPESLSNCEKQSHEASAR
jgi:hypothetical protein